MKANIKLIFVLHIVLAIYAVLGTASKFAAGEPFLSPKFILYYGIVIVNLFIYAIVWQQLLKRIPLVTAYANKAVTVIWGLIWGVVFFEEVITIQKIIGALIIVVGVCIVATSDNESEHISEK